MHLSLWVPRPSRELCLGPKPLPPPVIAARWFVTFVMSKKLARADERGITLLLG